MTSEDYTFYPYLERTEAIELVKKYSFVKIDELYKYADTWHTKAYYAPLATSVAGSDALSKIRDDVLNIADSFGFPKALPKRQVAKFDYDVGNYLFEVLKIYPSEASDERVWNFLTLVLMPDIAKWRFSNKSRNPQFERWIGAQRNVFRKTWWRAYTLGPRLNSQLGEDEGVNIMERPTFGGNVNLARCIAQEHVNRFNEYELTTLSRSDHLRRAMVHLSRWAVLVDFDTLPAEEMEKLVNKSFAASIDPHYRSQG